jgi:hypothetical protein
MFVTGQDGKKHGNGKKTGHHDRKKKAGDRKIHNREKEIFGLKRKKERSKLVCVFPAVHMRQLKQLSVFEMFRAFHQA